MEGLSEDKRLDTVLKLSDDGYILMHPDGSVADVNDEAARMLGVQGRALIDQQLVDVTVPLGSWPVLVQAYEKGARADVSLVSATRRRLMASLRRRPHADHIGLIKLCDLESFDYRRQLSEGEAAHASTGFLTPNKTRPDFEVQRRLCPSLHRVLSRGERAIQQGARILISGESGVGKSEIARFLHGRVARASDPFVSINCAMTTAEDLGVVLFGIAEQKDSAFFRAAGGTLFLDEVAEMPLSVQARLVGYLEDSALDTNRGAASIPLGPRLLVATNRDLQQLVKEGKFRADLFYRLAVVHLEVPPLRDIPSLIEHLTQRFLLTINRRRSDPVVFPERFLHILEDYSFPGNIRELLNIVQRGAIFIEDAVDMAELSAELLTTSAGSEGVHLSETATLDLKTEVRRFERALIDKAIQIHGSKRKAAKALGVDIGTISRKTANETTTKDDQ